MSISARKLCLVLLFGATLVAPLAALPTDPEKLASAEPPSTYVPDGTCAALTTDGYDGTLASMTCLTVPGVNLFITDVNVEVSMNHTWIGNLTIKVVSPEGTVSTLMSRPGLAEIDDDGGGCCGDSSDLIETSPITFDDAATDSAEDMGSTILGGAYVCQDDAICNYFPFPDTGPGGGLADFNGEYGSGDWLVCVGDSSGGDTGDVCNATVNISGVPMEGPIGVPTMSTSGLALLFLMLAGAGCWMIFRR